MKFLLQVLEISLLLGLMAKYSCEDCKLLLYNDGKHILCDIENQGTILTNLVSAKERVQVGHFSFIASFFLIYPYKWYNYKYQDDPMRKITIYPIVITFNKYTRLNNYNYTNNYYIRSIHTFIASVLSRGIMAIAPKFIRSHRIFGSVSSENFWTFAVGKDKGFDFYWKIIEFAPPCFAGATTAQTFMRNIALL